MDGLVRNLDSRTLWVEFGIDDEIIVRVLIVVPTHHPSLMACVLSHSLLTFRAVISIR
jgi:hypothetical protein